jgi:2-polyprenyl-3-methyl-5-hydroxy-6-metoxy-1,4-benzoquinol methylase
MMKLHRDLIAKDVYKMDETYKQKEDKKYSYLYSHGYGNGPVNDVVNRLRDLGYHDFGSIVDLGCGRGSLSQALTGYEKYTGIDIASSLQDFWWPDSRIKFLNGSILEAEGTFDTAFSIDVLEHLPTELVPEAIERMVKISKSQVIRVSTVPSKCLSETGENLHLTVIPGSTWHSIISEYTNIYMSAIKESHAFFMCGEPLVRSTEMVIPAVVCNQRTRVAPDNTFTVPRITPEVIKHLDGAFDRVDAGYRWTLPWNNSEGDPKITTLFNKAPDEYCYIIGKGPSLDKVTEKDFKDYPKAAIYCCNDSIKKIEKLDLPNPIYVLQQDAELGNQCYTEKGILIVHARAAHHYKGMKNRIRFFPQQLGEVLNLTVILALQLAHKMGSRKVIMIAFDSMVTQSVQYANCIGYAATRGGDPNRFLNHKSRAKPWLDKFEKVVWMSHL